MAAVCVAGMAEQVSYFDAEVATPGTLAEVLGDRAKSIDSLVVSGTVNAEDFRTMWKCAYEGRTRVLNLEKATIEGNAIPDCALYNPEIQDGKSGSNHKPLNIRRVILPEGITGIGENAFKFANVESLNIPESVEVLGEGAFAFCER